MSSSKGNASADPSDPFGKSQEFWARKESESKGADRAVAQLISRTSSRSLLSRNSVNNITAHPNAPPSAPAAPIQAAEPASPSADQEKRKSSRRDSAKKKTKLKANDHSGALSSPADTDQSDAEEATAVQKTSKAKSGDLPVAEVAPEALKVSPRSTPGTPVASRSNSESSLPHNRITTPVKRVESNLSAGPSSPEPVLALKHNSSSRPSSSSRGSSESPTRARKVSMHDRESSNSGSGVFLGPVSYEANASPSKRPTRVVSSELAAIKHELERERADRAILEAIVQQHQKLIETLNSKLERQSKLLVTLQQSVEMFSRPQRIGHSPVHSNVEPTFEVRKKSGAFEAVSKEDDGDDDYSKAPRKSKSVRTLSGAVHTKTRSKGSNDGDGGSNFGSDTNSVPDSDHVNVTLPSSANSKAAKRKSKSSKELVVTIDSTPSKHSSPSKTSVVSPETSSSSLASDANGSKKTKDKDGDKKKDKDSSEMMDERSKKRASRKSLVFHSDPSESQSAVSQTPDSFKKEKRKSKKFAPVDVSHDSVDTTNGSAEEVTLATSSIQFNSNPSVIPQTSSSSSNNAPHTPDHPTAPRRVKSASDKKSSHLRSADRGMGIVEFDVEGPRTPTKRSSRKKGDASVTDGEDYTPNKIERKKAKLSRATVSDNEDVKKPKEGRDGEIVILEPVKLKKKRRSERSSDRMSGNGGGIEIKSSKQGISDAYASPTNPSAVSSPELSSSKRSSVIGRDSGTQSDKDTVEKRSKSTSDAVRRRKSASISGGASPMIISASKRSKSPSREPIVRIEGRKDSSASESFEPLTAEAAHEASSPERERKRHSSSHAQGGVVLYSPGASSPSKPSTLAGQQFKQSSRKLEYEEEKALNPKRREVTSTRHGSSGSNLTSLDIHGSRSDSRSNMTIDVSGAGTGPPTPNADSSVNELTPRGSNNARGSHSPRAMGISIPTLTISRASTPIGGIGDDLSLSSTAHYDPARAEFEQARDDREANILSPRGRETMMNSSGNVAPPLTSRTMAVHFLSALPCNEIGIPVFLEQLCKFLLAEGTTCVALFEKRVDYARLENLRRKLETTLNAAPLGVAVSALGGVTGGIANVSASNNSSSGGGGSLGATGGLSSPSHTSVASPGISSASTGFSSGHSNSSGIYASQYTISQSKAIAQNIERDLKGEDPYVVAGVLKRWFLDLPDTLLMVSKSRYWLDVLEITDSDLCIAGLQTLYYSLDLNRRRVLRFFIDFLKQFVLLSSGGLTTLEDVSVRFGPLLLRAPGNSPLPSSRGGGPFAANSSEPYSAVPISLSHQNSSSNLSGSTEDSASPLATAGGPSSGGANSSASPGASATANASAVQSRIVRRGSARMEYELPASEQLGSAGFLASLLVKILITRDSEILKNHDPGIEFSRRPDLQYVVRAATPARILMLLIDQNYTEREFSQIIWDTCVYYTKPAALLSQFVAFYDKARGEAKWQSRMRMRILMAIKTWVKHSNFSLGPNKEFRSLLQKFSSEVMREMKEKDAEAVASGNSSAGNTSNLNSNSSAQMLDPESRILHSIMNSSMFERSDDTWLQWKLSRIGTCEPFKFDLQRHDPSLVAGQLALIHCRLLSMIHPSELTDNASLDAERSPNYTGVVQHINCLTTWVAFEVLSRSSIAERIRILTYYIDLAQSLLSLGDFLGCWAIRGAFDLHPVSRLTQTWERLPRKESAKNKKLTALFEPRMNFMEYRRALDAQLNETTFAIPILAFVPKDIIRVESSEPTFSEPGLVDMDKLRSIYYVLQHLSFAQSETFTKLNPSVKTIKSLWDFFANLPVIQESTLDQLSYHNEPRVAVPQSSRRTHSTSMSNPHRSSAQ